MHSVKVNGVKGLFQFDFEHRLMGFGFLPLHDLFAPICLHDLVVSDGCGEAEVGIKGIQTFGDLNL